MVLPTRALQPSEGGLTSRAADVLRRALAPTADALTGLQKSVQATKSLRVLGKRVSGGADDSRPQARTSQPMVTPVGSGGGSGDADMRDADEQMMEAARSLHTPPWGEPKVAPRRR